MPPVNVSGKAEDDVPSPWAAATHVDCLEEASLTLQELGPAKVMAAICRVNQQPEVLSLSHTVSCLSDKSHFFTVAACRVD